MPTTTVAGRQTARATPGKFITVTVSTPPPYGRFSIHDCVDPGQASPLNCIFPQNFASADGTTVKYGIVVHTVEPAPSASFIVSHSS